MPDLLYFDAYSGLSGDMTLGALLDLGLPLDYLQAELAKLKVPGFSLEKRTVEQHHISGLKLEVNLNDPHEHAHRSITDIEKIIRESGLAERVQERALAVFWNLARVEGAIHNLPPEEVHFHEVGAVDAIVDIVGACIGFEYFDISEFYCSPLPVGSGFVRAAHGLMPVPAPATLQLLAEAGAALAPTVTLSNGAEYPARAEMVTPTGAALVATLCRDGIGQRPPMKITKTGYGFGSKEFAWPNALRLWLGSRISNSKAAPATVSELVTGSAHGHEHTHDEGHSHTGELVHTHEDGHTHSHPPPTLTPGTTTTHTPTTMTVGKVTAILTTTAMTTSTRAIAILTTISNTCRNIRTPTTGWKRTAIPRRYTTTKPARSKAAMVRRPISGTVRFRLSRQTLTI